MSYDLYFWREQPGANIDADQLFNELDDAVEFPDIISLPLETVKAAFRHEFADINDDGGTMEWEGDGSYFQVGFTFLDARTVSSTSVFCGYQLLKSQNAMERLSRVATALEYRVHDPQQG